MAALKVIQVMLATDDTGLLWGAPIVADSGAVGFMTPDLELVGALPAMTYMNAAGAAVYSPSSGAPDGSAWNDETVIDDVMFSGLRLAEINGRPAVVFVKDQTHLVYVRADDAAMHRAFAWLVDRQISRPGDWCETVAAEPLSSLVPLKAPRPDFAACAAASWAYSASACSSFALSCAVASLAARAAATCLSRAFAACPATAACSRRSWTKPWGALQRSRACG